ncbi:MAG: DUF4180 domain-containing protein [Bacteroidales bacterium]|nr:DUF4180 domain-containing protein [Bacteroidales bacterium]
MEINIYQLNQTSIAELISDSAEIKELQDAIDIMANARYLGAGILIIHEHHLIPDFFDLSTRFAGEILQKFSNYRMQLAIVGDFSKYSGKSLRDFIYESNKTGSILFMPSVKEAMEKLTK